MSDEQHKSELCLLVDDLMNNIDSKPLHPKNRILLYSRYVLSKLSWHFTVTSLSKTWITENIDSVVKCYLRKWLNVPISGTLSSVFLTRNKFGLNIYPPSVKFIQCQTVLRTALKISPNEAINELCSQLVLARIFNSTFIVLPSKSLRTFAPDKKINLITSSVAKALFSVMLQNTLFPS